VKKLNQLASTAICGNDISSSVLYVSALAIAFAGQYAWITLLMVGGVLFLFRKIYSEVVGAIPLNGGVYNALLNSTSKNVASIAAVLTILSYMATAVISGNEAMHYLHSIIPNLPVLIATIVLLFLFCLLVINGIKESALVATIIFIFHLFSLVLLSVFIIYTLSTIGFSVFIENFHFPTKGSIWTAIFFGFAASMLGVSGFESSANFVEEQEKGVFPKTLRNMWVIVTITNPLMAFFALSLFTLPELQSASFQNTLLVNMGAEAGGQWLGSLIAIDASIVLSGAVLTSFVGVSGLLERMTLDRILPNYFLKKNKNGNTYRITLTFFLLCVSVLLFTKGEVKLLAGVYTISFLSVMALFGIGNILLKIKRKTLPRPIKAPLFTVLIAIIAVIIALIGNIIMPSSEDSPSNLGLFLIYFIPFLLLIELMLNRTLILKVILNRFKKLSNSFASRSKTISDKINKSIERINSQEFVFFAFNQDIAILNKAMLYIQNNEHTKQVKIIVLIKKEQELSANIKTEIDFLDREYPEIKVSHSVIKNEFSPKLVKSISKELNIPIHFMFIAASHHKFKYNIEEFGGIRIIL